MADPGMALSFEAWWAAHGDMTLRYLSIPIVASLIGYGTNVLAIQMTFLPLEYFGAPFWPAKAA